MPNTIDYIVAPAGVNRSNPNVAYYCNGANDHLQINRAIAACNAAGGGTVTLKPGTYNISQPISLLSNVTLQGVNHDSTTIKASANYFSTAGSHSMIHQLSSTTSINVYDIIFDRNGQNENNKAI